MEEEEDDVEDNEEEDDKDDENNKDDKCNEEDKEDFFAKMLKMTKYTSMPNLVRLAQWEQ